MPKANRKIIHGNDGPNTLTICGRSKYTSFDMMQVPPKNWSKVTCKRCLAGLKKRRDIKKK